MKAHKLQLTCLVTCDLPYLTRPDGDPIGFVGPDGRHYRPQVIWEVADEEKGLYHDAGWEEMSALGLDWDYDDIELFQVGDEVEDEQTEQTGEPSANDTVSDDEEYFPIERPDLEHLDTGEDT